MTKKKRKYVPSIEVPSDDLVVVDDEGNEHHPHEGEKVVFRKGVPLRVMRVMRRVTNIPEFEELDDEALEKLSERERERYERKQQEMANQYGELSEELIRVLARQILDWDWTSEEWDEENERFKPLPRPVADRAAFVEALWDLDDAELAWLQEHYTDGATASKN